MVGGRAEQVLRAELNKDSSGLQTIIWMLTLHKRDNLVLEFPCSESLKMLPGVANGCVGVVGVGVVVIA